MHEIIPFSTSIFVDTLYDTDKLIEKIREIRDADDEKIQVSNYGGWQSPYGMQKNLMTQHLFLQPFMSQIAIRLKTIYEQYGYDHYPILDNYWFNINKKYNYNLQHHHGKCLFSAVLYLKVPKDSGRIMFKRTDGMSYWCNFDRLTEKNFLLYHVNPGPGILVMFPAFMDHYVEQNLTEEEDDERISIAMNFN